VPRTPSRLWLPAVLALALFAAPAPALWAQEAETAQNPDHDRYVQPPEAVRALFATDKNYATLDYPSPDGDHFLVVKVNELSTLELMSRETYRLAELELRPRTDRLWHLDTYGIHDFRFYSLSAGRWVEVDLPEGAFASDFTWSPDGTQMAFLAHLPTHTEVWTADPATGRTRRWSEARVLATVGTSANGQGTRPSEMLQWTPEGTLLTLLVPADRGPEPDRSRIPPTVSLRLRLVDTDPCEKVPDRSSMSTLTRSVAAKVDAPTSGGRSKVTSSALRVPNGSQIREGMKVKWSRGSSTTTSWRASRRLRRSSAAVIPAKLDPRMTTRCAGDDEDMKLTSLQT